MSQAGTFGTLILPPGEVVETIQGNINGPVSPDAFNNIHVKGDGTTITVTGSPGTNTLTISATGSIATTYHTDAGNAVPAADILNVIGGQGITVSGADNTVTIASTGIFYTFINVNTSPYFVLDTDVYLSVDVSAIPITILLPDNALLGEPFVIKDRTGNAAIRNINVTTVSGLTMIDGVTSFIIDTAYQSVSIVGNGTTYEIY